MIKLRCNDMNNNHKLCQSDLNFKKYDYLLIMAFYL